MKLAPLILALCLAALPATASPPQRVVSLNLCTDQLAMLLAAEGQLVSVSRLATDPRYSSVAAEASELTLNTGQAEEIAALRPDLVLAGRYTTTTTVSLLKRLGFRVELFEPENSIADIRANVLRMGEVLHRPEAARAAVAAIDEKLATLDAYADRPKTALYFIGGYTSASGSLGDDIIDHAGLANIADIVGLTDGGTMPLEALVLAAPDVVIRGQQYSAPSRGQELLDHPALALLLSGERNKLETSPEWTCGTPFTVEMIAHLADEARRK